MPHSSAGNTLIEAAVLLPGAAIALAQLAVTVLAAQCLAQLSSLRTSVRRGLHEIRRPMQLLMMGRLDPANSDADAIHLLREACKELEGTVTSRHIGRQALVRNATPDSMAACHELVEAALDRWSPVAEIAGRTIEAGGSRCKINLPVAAFSQALDNLVANALTHARGPITISIGEASGAICVVVRDGGGGAFQPRHPGSRLHGHGLNAARGHLRRLGGTLHHESSSSGSSFTMFIPRDDYRSRCAPNLEP